MSENKLSFDSPSVQSYLGILQAVIARMANNSSACKTWCIGLVSAIVVVVAGKREPSLIWISLIPVVLFLVLDAYYLALEKAFRDRYNDFIAKLHNGEAALEDVFIVTIPDRSRTTIRGTFCAVGSFSVWPFYGLLGLMLVAVRLWVLGNDC